MKKKFISISLLSALIFSGCTNGVSKESVNLMDGIKGGDVSPIEIEEFKDDKVNKQEEITNLGLELLRENYEEENILLSPLSIVSALGMVTNGARENTLLEMEEVLGSDIEGVNKYLSSYRSYLPSAEGSEVSLANSIWFKDKEGLEIEEDFLITNKNFYDAEIYKAAFDSGTKDDINAWVDEKTDGMIESLLDKDIPKDAIMYLINALAFDAEWKDIYEETSIYEDYFITENKEEQKVEFMTSSEYSYLENDKLTGFIKPYKDEKYGFVALLPKEGLSIKEVLDNLGGQEINKMLENKVDEKVYTRTPKFSVEYEVLLNESLERLGMRDAFDIEEADFKDLGTSIEGNICISRVIHKTKIDLDERGTKAGAVTAVEMIEETAYEEDPKEVILNRPFIYMIVDMEENLPLFIGSLMNLD